MKITIRLTAEMEETLKKMVKADQEFVAEHNAKMDTEQHLTPLDIEIAAFIALEDGLKLASQKEAGTRGAF